VLLGAQRAIGRPAAHVAADSVHAVLWAQRTTHAPHQTGAVSRVFFRLWASAVCWRACARAAERGRRGRATQARSGPSRRSTPTWPTTASLPTCSRPASGPVSRPAAACRAGAESRAGLGGARCALVWRCPLRVAWCLCPCCVAGLFQKALRVVIFFSAERTLAALPGGRSLPGSLNILTGLCAATDCMVRRARHSLPCIDPMSLSKRRAVR